MMYLPVEVNAIYAIALSTVYRQKTYHWYWEAYYYPNIRPGWLMRVETADHEGENIEEFHQDAIDCAYKVPMLNLKAEGLRDGQDEWCIYGKREDYPFMCVVGTLKWLELQPEATQ